jgi:hypothetical protein
LVLAKLFQRLFLSQAEIFLLRFYGKEFHLQRPLLVVHKGC